MLEKSVSAVFVCPGEGHSVSSVGIMLDYGAGDHGSNCKLGVLELELRFLCGIFQALLSPFWLGLIKD